MIGWLLDTNVLSALANPNGAPSVKRWAAAADEHRMFISILTLAEYDKGIANLAPDDPNAHRYAVARDALEGRFAARVLSLSDPIVRRWGVLSGEVKLSTGHAPPVIDTMLAASAMEHDLYLVTRNVRDMRMPGVAVFDPWQDDAARFPLSRR